MSTAVEGKAIEDIKIQLAALQTTMQEQRAKIEELEKEVKSLKIDGKNEINPPSCIQFQDVHLSGRANVQIVCELLAQTSHVNEHKLKFSKSIT